MKTFSIILVILLVAGFLSSETYADADNDKIVKECLAEGGITNEQSKHSLKFDDPKMKCLFTCIKTKLGLIVDGKISLEKLKETLSKNKSMDDATKENIKLCVEQANQQTGCEVGFIFVKCVQEKIYKGKLPTGEKGQNGM